MRIKDLYINSKNVVTVVPYKGDYEVGLAINGIRYTLENWNGLLTDEKHKEWQEECLQKANRFQEQLIEEIENKTCNCYK